ncbi:MAG: hypothetical protein EBZ47_06270 [Chlamydiae bacterium]|nr:hypothetical protein [Chlamydiota bacterium]
MKLDLICKKWVIFLALGWTCGLQANNSLATQEESVVVIGTGTGGLTSALFLAKAGFKPIVLLGDNKGRSISSSLIMDNWLGFPKISGQELSKDLLDQAKASGAIFLDEEAIFVDFSKKPFSIVTRNLTENNINTLKASSCIIDTGSRHKKLGIQGESDLFAKGVYTHATYSGTRFQGQPVVVVGGGDNAILDADYLSNLASKVYVIVKESELKAKDLSRINALKNKKNVEILMDTTLEEFLTKKGQLIGIKIISGKKTSKIDTSAVFLAIGSVPSSKIFNNQLSMDINGFIQVDCNMKTSVDGVYAVGDVCDPNYEQAIVAAGDGAKAAIHWMRSSSTIANPVAKNIESLKESNQEIQTIPNVPFENEVSNSHPSDAPSSVIEIKSINQYNELVQLHKIPVLVEFYSAHSNTCRKLNAPLQKYAKAYQGKMQIFKVDIQKCPGIADFFQIKGVPLALVFGPDKSIMCRLEGSRQITAYLNQYSDLAELKH